MAHTKIFLKVLTKLSTQLCLLKQKDICIYKFQSKTTKKTFVDFAFYYTNIRELLFSSIASKFYTATFEVINRLQSKVNKKKHFFDFDCLR